MFGNGGCNEQQFKQINKDIKTASRRDKEKHISNICKELERRANRHETQKIFNKVIYLSRKFKPRTQRIKIDHGVIINNLEDITGVWKNYCQKLCADNSEMLCEDIQTIKELYILRSEVQKAIQVLRCRKSPGADGITAEVLKAAGDRRVDIFHSLCNLNNDMARRLERVNIHTNF